MRGQGHTLTRDNAKKQLRAVLGVPIIDFKVAPNAPMVAAIQIKNFGETVANDYSISDALEFYVLPAGVYEPNQDVMNKLRPIQQNLPFSWERTVILPGQTKNEIRFSNEILSADQYNEILSKQAVFMAFGRIRYTDIFGDQHIALYCGYYDPILAAAQNYQGSVCGGLNSLD